MVSLGRRGFVEHAPHLYNRSPTGNLLLTKLNRGIKVWTEVSANAKDAGTSLTYSVSAGRRVPEDN